MTPKFTVVMAVAAHQLDGKTDTLPKGIGNVHECDLNQIKIGFQIDIYSKDIIINSNLDI